MVLLGEELRGFRTSQHTSLEEFAFNLNISPSTLSKYENNKLPTPLPIVKEIYKKYREPKLVKIYRDNILNQIDEVFLKV